MKKVLAAVLAVALVAVVGVAVNGVTSTPAPVEDDAVIVAAAPAEDETPAVEVKTAVLGTSTEPDEPSALSEDGDEPETPETPETTPDSEGEGDEGDDTPATPAAKDEVRAKSDLAPGDSVALDSDGAYTGSVSITFSNSSSDVVRGYNNDYASVDNDSDTDYEETFKDVFGEDAYNEVFGDGE